MSGQGQFNNVIICLAWRTLRSHVGQISIRLAHESSRLVMFKFKWGSSQPARRRVVPT